MRIDSSARLAAIAHPDPIVRNTLLETCLNFRQADIKVTRPITT